MLQHILIAEDHKSSNSWVRQFLSEMGITSIQPAYYCDDALLALKKGIEGGQPYELLITDLSFFADHREQNLSNGIELIAAAKALQPDLKILVFSGEQQPEIISGLFRKYDINGYVCKGRKDAEELEAAVKNIAKHKKYIPFGLLQTVRSQNTFDFSDFDVVIISMLATGISQKKIPVHLKTQKMKASSLSSVEKRLKFIKDEFGFTNNEQLIAYCKDKRVI